VVLQNAGYSGSRKLEVAVVGSGISGLSAAWLLSKRHRVTLYEANAQVGGHSNTVDVGGVAVDTGFIVYNEATYPNFSALLDHLGVATKPTNMTFAVSLGDGRLEYSGTGLTGLFSQPRNAVSLRFWGMLRDLVRFYREAPQEAHDLGDMSLDAYLDASGYGTAFRQDHLYPMAAAIWSTPAAEIGEYPARAFVRFCENHGLLKLTNRPLWRTLVGGSRAYVEKFAQAIPEILTNEPILAVRRHLNGVEIVSAGGETRRFDHVVIATHADQALAMLADPTPEEDRLLGAFGYCANSAVLHSDATLMPHRRRVWSSWNYMSSERGNSRSLAVSYWMNRLQGLRDAKPMFLTLNAHRPIREESILYATDYTHPIFNARAMNAQSRLWSLQGQRNTWFCGAYFGAGFHEDGLQAGLAVAEALAGGRRPWIVANESSRISINETAVDRPRAPVQLEVA
jgi:predicted NAD/FAD-binding protein